MIKVLFFGQLRDVLGTDSLGFDINEFAGKVLDVAQFRAHLQAKGDLWQEYLDSERSLVAVNQTMATETALIKGDDEVAFFPPVTGG
jgi:molybdopterin synthase sulfur carrier subunit